MIILSAFELGIIAAPRSMQGTAIGIVFIIEGLSNLVSLGAIYSPKAPMAIAVYSAAHYYVGIGLNLVGMVAVILIHRKWKWHILAEERS